MNSIRPIPSTDFSFSPTSASPGREDFYLRMIRRCELITRRKDLSCRVARHESITRSMLVLVDLRRRLKVALHPLTVSQHRVIVILPIILLHFYETSNLINLPLRTFFSFFFFFFFFFFCFPFLFISSTFSSYF